ncbi:50S ribosomal protein L24 [Psychromonas sp. CNPT3]|uniref:50S ribosomal protein L24 n=1 Tax=Psychromonas sp. CNPT3 TaxID=314282 RepID=UPI00006E9D18|nr:50S ribosomal protein L24 [Psychromonas sp. CNPT3]AGH80159.1 50S ribosomal protein L24 [Psychromonas sp. CNPT3]
MAAKLKRDDEVIVIAGKDKGKTGKISTVLANGKIIIEGVNTVKKHQKPNPQAGVTGGIITQEAPIEVSNVAILNPATGKGDRVGFRIENEQKVRFFKSNNELVK